MKKILFSLLLALAFIACKKERDCPGSVDRNLSFTNFRNIKAGETFTLTIRQGTDFRVKASGCEADLNDLQASIDNGGTLVLSYNRYEKKRNRVYFDITLPTLNSVVLTGAAEATVGGFGAQTSRLRTVLSGASKCAVDGLSPVTEVDVSGASHLSLAGTTNTLSGRISGGSKMDAYPATSNEADLDVSGASTAYVKVQASLVAVASGASRIYYKGNPPHTQLEQNDASKIIHE